MTIRSETLAGRLLSSRFGPLWAVLGAAGLAVVAILAFRGSRAERPEEPGQAQGTITVPAIPDSIRDEIPSTWAQPRNDPAGRGVWGPDIQAPLDTLWRIHTGLEFFAAPALCGSTLYFGGSDGTFRAVDATDGAVLWSFGTSCGLSGEAAVGATTVFFSGQDGYAYALDLSTGALVWKTGLGYHLFASIGILGDSIVVTGNSAGSIAALDARTGDLVWSASPGGVVLGPAVADTVAVFTTEDGIVCAYGAGGEEIWRRDFPAQASAPSVSGGSVYVGFADGVVRSLDLSSGAVVWETDLTSQPVRTVVSRPVVEGGRVFAGTCDSRVVCLSEDGGALLWETGLENWVQVPPAVGDENVYVCCDDRRFHILDAATGALESSMEMGGYAGTAPIIANGSVFFGTASGDFFAFLGTLGDSGGQP
ncbi:MAG: PQQ-binding-like beta-propeller repeat protein [Candidatus Fermentibacter sp.]|nr:PQQ-binding-like beta-propeller repeat protein [Candidatus Fermentibacter sp.]